MLRLLAHISRLALEIRRSPRYFPHVDKRGGEGVTLDGMFHRTGAKIVPGPVHLGRQDYILRVDAQPFPGRPLLTASGKARIPLYSYTVTMDKANISLGCRIWKGGVTSPGAGRLSSCQTASLWETGQGRIGKGEVLRR